MITTHSPSFSLISETIDENSEFGSYIRVYGELNSITSPYDMTITLSLLMIVLTL